MVGRVLSGRYELRAMLGRGGMGEVYEAADLALDRTVAVKVLRPELTADRRFVARFHREARIAARLRHPGIVGVYDAGEHDGRVCIVLEHVPGRTLAELVRHDGPIEPGRAARIAADVADALAHAHSRGIVHRDVTPGNVMVAGDDRVTVLDFGIARAAQGSMVAGSMTAHGTLAYAAPEVLAGHRADQRVDVYGLGAVLYELLTGRPPFQGSGERAIAQRLRVARPVPPRAWNPQVPDELDRLVRRCLTADPAARPDDLAHVAVELRGLAVAVAEHHTQPLPEADGTRFGRTTARLPVPGSRHEPGSRLVPAEQTRPMTTQHLRAASTRPQRGRARGGRLTRAFAWVTLLVVALGGGALVVPSLLTATRPMAATAVPPPRLAAPADLTVSTSCDGWWSTGADLSWTPVDGADGYEIWRIGTADDAFELVATTGAATTAVRDADLGIDTTYRYRVRATEGPRVGAWSAQAEALTPLLCLT